MIVSIDFYPLALIFSLFARLYGVNQPNITQSPFSKVQTPSNKESYITSTEIVVGQNRSNSTLQTATQPPIYKCLCLADEILDNNQCKPHKTFVNVYNKIFETSFPVKTTDFADIVTKNLICGKNQYQKTISSFLLGKLFLYDTINIKLYTPREYCMEHIKVNGEISLVFKVCARIPSLTQCCPKGSIFSQTNSCVSDENLIFKPPFADGSRIINIPGDVKRINECINGYVLRYENISRADSSYSLLISLQDEGVLTKYSHGFDLGNTIESSDFCIAASKDNYGYYYQAEYCEEDPNLRRKQRNDIDYYKKCCPLDYIFNDQFSKCTKADTKMPFPFIKNDTNTNYDFLESKRFIIGGPFCDGDIHMYRSDMGASLEIRDNGEISLKIDSKPIYYEDYCVENVGNELEVKEMIFVCHEQFVMESSCYWEPLVISGLLGISTSFLLATLVVYLGIKDLRKRTSGKCLISEVVALFISYITLIIIKTGHDQLSPLGCQIAGVIEHIAILASFFWLTVMCCDIWMGVRSIKPPEQRSQKAIIAYSIIGWGGPVFIAIIAVTIDHLSSNEMFDHLIAPGFGVNNCFFADWASQWIYLYSIIIVLLCINGVLCLLIGLELRATQKKVTQSVHSRESSAQGKSENERFCVYFKLFILMGFTWIAEVISFELEHRGISCLYWFPTDVINALRGVAIFIISVCEKRTLNKVRKKFIHPALGLARRMSSVSRSLNTESKTKSSGISGVAYHPSPL